MKALRLEKWQSDPVLRHLAVRIGAAARATPTCT